MALSNTKRRKVLRVLEALKYYPASMTEKQALTKILRILEIEDDRP